MENPIFGEIRCKPFARMVLSFYQTPNPRATERRIRLIPGGGCPVLSYTDRKNARKNVGKGPARRRQRYNPRRRVESCSEWHTRAPGGFCNCTCECPAAGKRRREQAGIWFGSGENPRGTDKKKAPGLKPGRRFHKGERMDYIMPSMPPAGAAGAFFSSGMSVIMHSVVSRRPATEAAFCRARRVTLAGSTMPEAIMST